MADLEELKRNVKHAFESESLQRFREREDLEFQDAENQWSPEARKERRGGEQGSLILPPRPMLSISLLQQPLQLVHNQAANAQLGVNLDPVTEKADDDLAEIKQGLYRRIERDSNAIMARLWAVDRAIQCGRGWYRVNTQWDEDGDDPWDQEITIERILDGAMVYMDPSAQKPDFSDAMWGFVMGYVPLPRYRQLWPKASTTSNDVWEDIARTEPMWVKGTGEQRAVLVAEYFYKEEQVLRTVNHPTQKGRQREIVTTAVKLCKASAVEKLEESDWNGSLIPLIPAIGRELQMFDGERRWEGMVRPARHAQMMFNFGISSVVEDISRIGKAPYVGAEGQFEGHEKEWAQANVRNLPYLEYKLQSLGDKMAPPPGPMQVDGTKMQTSMMLVQEGKNLVQTATAIYDPSLGRESSRDKSGRAILALQQQADAGTSHYIWNLANISMTYEARVVLDLMPKIYDRPGRITRVLGEDDETDIVMLGKPFVPDQQGRPRAVPPNTQGAKIYDLSKGKYSISVSIGKSFQTRLQEGQELWSELIPNVPPQAQLALLPTVMQFQSIPGAKEATDVLKKLRDSMLPGLTDDKSGQMTPDQLQSKLAAQEQQIQQMGQQMQIMQQALEIDKMKQEAMLQKAQFETAAKERMNTQDNQTALLIAQLKASIDRLTAGQEQAHERQQGDMDRAHEVAMADAGGRTTTFSRQSGQETDRESEKESGQTATREQSSENEAGYEQEQETGE